MADRAKRVATQTSRTQFEIARSIVPFLAAQTARREHIQEQANPIRAAVSVLRDEAPKIDRPDSALAAELAEIVPGSRREEREAAQRQLATTTAADIDHALRREER
jgi:hypothetical protein